jgi:hypothetical protein
MLALDYSRLFRTGRAFVKLRPADKSDIRISPVAAAQHGNREPILLYLVSDGDIVAGADSVCGLWRISRAARI